MSIFGVVMGKATVFWLGRSQAVRLPKAFRIEQDEVRIRRQGAAVILEPVPTDWGWLDAISGPVDPDFDRMAGEEAPGEERPELDHFERGTCSHQCRDRPAEGAS